MNHESNAKGLSTTAQTVRITINGTCDSHTVLPRTHLID